MSLLLNWLESLHKEIKISSRCTRVGNRKSTCSDCLEKCKYGAIEKNDHLLKIDANKCSFCGECVMACPLSAIEGIAVNRVFEKGSLIFDDAYTPSVKELLIYKKRGMNSIQVNRVPLNSEWAAIVEETNEQLRLLDDCSIEIVEKVDEETLSRRDFIHSFKKEGKQLAKNLAPISWKMEMDGWKLPKYYPAFQFFSVELNKNQCTLCQACFVLCSEDVFSLRDSFLQIENEKCVNCSSCTDVCPEEAITITPEIKRKSDKLESLQQRKCKDCGQTFHTFQTETEKCHVCIHRDPEWLSPY